MAAPAPRPLTGLADTPVGLVDAGAAARRVSRDEASELEQVLARPAARHANYLGDQRHMAELHQLMGPNGLGEVLVAVEAAYDPRLNETRLGFVFVPHHLVGLAERRPDGTVVFGQVER